MLRGFPALDILLIAVIVGISLLGLQQRLLRQLLWLAALYLSSALAALFYPYAALYVSAIGGSTPRFTEAIMFWVVLTALWLAFELLARRAFEDTRLPRLGVLDRLGGLLIGFVIGLVVASLLFATLGYALQGTWGRRLASVRTALGEAYPTAYLGPVLRQILQLVLASQRFWFGAEIPPLVGYSAR